MNTAPKFNSRYSLYCKQFGNTSGCRIYFLMIESHGHSFPQLGLQPSHPSSALPTSQRPTQLYPTYTAYSWRTQGGKLFSRPMNSFLIFFFPCKSGQTPEQTSRGITVFILGGVQIPPDTQWRSYPRSQCSQASKSPHSTADAL